MLGVENEISIQMMGFPVGRVASKLNGSEPGNASRAKKKASFKQKQNYKPRPNTSKDFVWNGVVGAEILEKCVFAQALVAENLFIAITNAKRSTGNKFTSTNV